MTAPHEVGVPAPASGRRLLAKSAAAAVVLTMLGWWVWTLVPGRPHCAPPEMTSHGDSGAAWETARLPIGTVPTHMVTSADGRRVYVLDPFGVWAVDPVRNAVVGHYGGPETSASPRRAAVSPDGARLYVTEGNGILDVLDTATMTRVASGPVGGAHAGGVATSADGRYVWVGHHGAGVQDSAVSVLDAATLAPAGVVPVPGVMPDVLTVARAPLLYAGGLGGQTQVIDMSRRKVIAEFDYSTTEGVMLAPNGDCGYIAGAFHKNSAKPGTKFSDFPDEDQLSVLDTRTQRWLGAIPRDTDISRRPRPWVVAASPNNRYLFGINVGQNDQVEVIDTVAWQVTARIGVPDQVQHIAVSTDGRRLYLTSVTGNALLTVDVSRYAPTDR